MLVEDIQAKLLSKRYEAEAVPPIEGAGVYAFFLDRGNLPGVIVEPGAPLYVGMTESSLAVRNHFTHADSGFSSPRRTLGALLKMQLRLQPRPRGYGSSPTNITNYRFQDEGEQRLTAWMKGQLSYGFAVVDTGVKAMERALIADLHPALNLTGWPNPNRTTLREIRCACRKDAAAQLPIS